MLIDAAQESYPAPGKGPLPRDAQPDSFLHRETLLAQRTQWVTEPTPTKTALYLLTTEQDLYRALVAGTFGPCVRLEQERVSFASLEGALVRYREALSMP